MSDSIKPRGYSSRPLPLLIINIGYMLMPIIYLAILIYFAVTTPDPLYGFKFLEYITVLIVMPAIVAITMLWMNTASFWVTIIHSTLLIVHNIYIIFSYSRVNITVLVLFILFQVVSALVIFYFILAHSNFRQLFFNKRLRWWQTNARYKVSIPATLLLENGKSCTVTLEDLSIGGVCVISNAKKIESMDARNIEFTWNNMNFESNLDYIWEEKDRIGLKFMNYDLGKQKVMKKIIAELEKENNRKNGR
jgi:hypothetical protein